MIDPKKELFKWGPIDGRPIYVDAFVEAFVPYKEFIDGTWPDIFGYIKDDKVVFFSDYKELRDRGAHLFRNHVMDKKKREKAYAQWVKVTEKIRKYEGIVNKGLSDADDEYLRRLFDAWNIIHIDFWLTGFLPELSNWGGEKILKQKITEFDRINFIEIFEKLSAPEELSFFQKEGLEFMKIRLMKKAEQDDALRKHQARYYWLRNNYGFTKVLDIGWFSKELDNIDEKKAKEKIREIEGYPSRIKKQKKEIIKRYKISREITDIAENLAYCVWWQDYRKSFIFIANHIVTQFLEEISKRKAIDFKELCYYTTYEIEDLLKKGRKVDARKRFNGFIEMFHEHGEIEHITYPDTERIMKPFLEIEIDEDMEELKGMVVSSGDTVKGRAKILSSPKEIDKMDQGDILIAPMTSPDYIVAMRKASAIITDEGGMTSHAAIVSRELGVPCIVQTKLATKWLKDGDMIKVDTKRGVVRKIR